MVMCSLCAKLLPHSSKILRKHKNIHHRKSLQIENLKIYSYGANVDPKFIHLSKKKKKKIVEDDFLRCFFPRSVLFDIQIPGAIDAACCYFHL